MPARSSTAINAPAFAAAFAATPKPLPAGSSEIQVRVNALTVSLAGLPAALQGQTLAFFPETGNVTEPAAPVKQSWQGPLWKADTALTVHRTESPSLMPLVVAFNDTAYRVEVPVTGAWPAVAPAVQLPPALEVALKANAAAGAAPIQSGQTGGAPLGLLAALLGALVGGLILNLMPCVFPVLAIKVVGFVQVKNRADRAATGLAYTAGVVLSFLALGTLLLGLRATGEHLGWGFQLQNPAEVAALAVLITRVGLNLAGL